MEQLKEDIGKLYVFIKTLVKFLFWLALVGIVIAICTSPFWGGYLVLKKAWNGNKTCILIVGGVIALVIYSIISYELEKREEKKLASALERIKLDAKLEGKIMSDEDAFDIYMTEQGYKISKDELEQVGERAVFDGFKVPSYKVHREYVKGSKVIKKEFIDGKEVTNEVTKKN